MAIPRLWRGAATKVAARCARATAAGVFPAKVDATFAVRERDKPGTWSRSPFHGKAKRPGGAATRRRKPKAWARTVVMRSEKEAGSAGGRTEGHTSETKSLMRI